MQSQQHLKRSHMFSDSLLVARKPRISLEYLQSRSIVSGGAVFFGRAERSATRGIRSTNYSDFSEITRRRRLPSPIDPKMKILASLRELSFHRHPLRQLASLLPAPWDRAAWVGLPSRCEFIQRERSTR